MNRRSLLTFVGRRLVALVLVVMAISFIVFSLLYLAPGNVVQVLLGTRPSNPALIHSLRQQYHLDDPFLQQYWLWLRDALQLKLGTSIHTGESVRSVIGQRAGVTLFVALYALILAVGVGVPLGILAALRSRTPVDRGVVAFSVVGVSAPSFVTGTIFLYLFAVTLGWFPIYGAGSGFLDRLWHLTLPALALSLTSMALALKLTRAAMIGALEQDYVTFARARGVPMRRVIVRHALRNALIPIITAIGLLFTGLLTATVLVEVTFSLPGAGALLVEAVQDKDVPVLQGLTLVVAAAIVLTNIAVDVLYTLVDPRIRLGSAA